MTEIGMLEIKTKEMTETDDRDGAEMIELGWR